MPELLDAASSRLAALEPELPVLQPGVQPALFLEPVELRGAAEQEAEPEQLPAAAFL